MRSLWLELDDLRLILNFYEKSVYQFLIISTTFTIFLILFHIYWSLYILLCPFDSFGNWNWRLCYVSCSVRYVRMIIINLVAPSWYQWQMFSHSPPDPYKRLGSLAQKPPVGRPIQNRSQLKFLSSFARLSFNNILTSQLTSLLIAHLQTKEKKPHNFFFQPTNQ